MRTTDPKRLRILFACIVTAVLVLSACSPAAEKEMPEPVQQEQQAGGEGTTCAAHDAPKEQCFICDASLRDKGRLWCREHARYEDRCWLCHPELEEADRLWCKEHSLYEDECFLCHPELLEGAKAPSASSELNGLDLMCNEHGVPERECGICHPELLTQDLDQPGLKVRLSSLESAAKAGVRVGTPNLQRMEDGVGCFAELRFNQNKLAEITSLVGGVVKQVEVDLGSRVEQGDLLATITSETIGEAQSNYLQRLAEAELSTKVLERKRGLLAERISSEREYQEAEAAHHASAAALRQAQQRLRVLGFNEGQVGSLADKRMTPGVLELRAPFGGEIVQRAVVQGAVVHVADVLFTLADTTMLWAMLNIPESQLSRVDRGQTVGLTVESLPGQTFEGTLTWISAMVDERTRMAQGRVEVPNRGGRLKAQMFAHARISTGHSHGAVVVPLSAVQNVTGMPIVFVKSAEDLFEARPVTLGIKYDGGVQIATGLGSDETVVVAGGFALKSQLLASRLGAGCVHE